SISVIVDRDGLIVAHPDAKQALKREASGTMTRVRLNELSDPLPSMAFGLRVAEAKNQFTFSHKGEEYVAMFSPFPPEFGKPWDVAIVAPLEDFVGEWKSNNRKLLSFGLA